MLPEKCIHKGITILKDTAVTLESTYNLVRSFETVGQQQDYYEDTLNCPYSYADNYENPYAHLDATYFRLQKLSRFFAKLMENNIENKFLI